MSKWECPACGNILRVQDIIVQKGTTCQFKAPTKCACGRSGRFRLMDFEPMNVAIHSTDTDAITIPHDLTDDVMAYAQKKLKGKKE